MRGRNPTRRSRPPIVPPPPARPTGRWRPETGLQAYLEFVREHPGLYRIISEAEFVANDAFMEHYSGFARAYQANLAAAAKRGEIRSGDVEVWSWALMGMVVFLGMRYGEWGQDMDTAEVAERAIDLVGGGLAGAGEKERR